jgi:hypothetical protein
MAIIRKGDKKAEASLSRRAKQQEKNRNSASENQKERAGLISDAVFINPSTKGAYTRSLGNPITKDAYKISTVQFRGPISGSSKIGK